MVACALEPRRLARAEAVQARSHHPGEIVILPKGEKGRSCLDIGNRVEGIDSEAGTVRLVPDRGKAHDWQAARWGSARTEAFVKVKQRFRAGDKVQFTRSNYWAERQNGDPAEVVAINPMG